MAEMVTLGKEFSDDLNELAKLIENWGKGAEKKFKKAHQTIGQRWKAEAVKRAPVAKGTLVERIVTNSYSVPGGFETECGSNVPHAVFTEFGTRHIAGGRVLALGQGAVITDAQAIKNWPAKDAGRRDPDGSVNSIVAAAEAARAARGSANEQMPWLRPAFHSIRDWAINLLSEALEIPRK